MEQQVVGNTFAAVSVNRSTPAHVVNHLAEPHDYVQTVYMSLVRHLRS